jgi:hypothetical protein
MIRSLTAVSAALIILLACLPAGAQAAGDSVGLGVSLGAAFPSGSTSRIATVSGEASFDWGFYVNIPLIYTFHLTPSSELYKLGAQNATDMDLAFKFIVPLSRFSLYGGVAPGLTTTGEVTAMHVGLLAGASFNLVSNLDAFAQAKYQWVFEGNQNLRVLHLNAGMLFNFR